MLEKKEQTRRVREVVISGNIEGYDVASIEDLKEIMDHIVNIRGQIVALRRLAEDLQKAIS